MNFCKKLKMIATRNNMSKVQIGVMNHSIEFDESESGLSLSTLSRILGALSKNYILALLVLNFFSLNVDQTYASTYDTLVSDSADLGNRRTSVGERQEEVNEENTSFLAQNSGTNAVSNKPFSVYRVIKKSVNYLAILGAGVMIVRSCYTKSLKGKLRLYLTSDECTQHYARRLQEINSAERSQKAQLQYDVFNSYATYIETNPTQWLSDCLKNITPKPGACFAYYYGIEQEIKTTDYNFQFTMQNCQGVDPSTRIRSDSQYLIITSENAIRLYTHVKGYYGDQAKKDCYEKKPEKNLTYKLPPLTKKFVETLPEESINILLLESAEFYMWFCDNK